MEFSKPRVTIDLEEYEYLKSLETKESVLQEAAGEELYQIVLGRVVSTMPHGMRQELNRFLRSRGITSAHRWSGAGSKFYLLNKNIKETEAA